ncbi:MAG: radical SAM protein [Candidatus Diapherotrites archaeon]
MITLVYPRTPELLAGGSSAPLGIQYIASYLAANKIKSEIIDLTFTSWKEYKQRLKQVSPKFIGFSIQTPIAKNGLRAIEIAKKICPHAKVIVGGAHATVDTANMLKNKHVDFLVVGEGEKIFLNIIKGKIKERLVYGEHVEKLDVIPFPNRKLIDYGKYLRMNHEIEIMMSRGCPYNCIFCQPTQRKLFGDKVKLRSPENVVAEIKQIINNYGSNFIFYFLDDTFTWNLDWLKKFCESVKPLKINWKCSTRVNLIDKEKLEMMKDAGCTFINYGVESGSQKILNFMRKGITVKQIKEAFKMTHKAEILCHAFIIIGTPTETKEDLEMTVRLIKEIHPDGIQVSIMTPLIGTDLEKYCLEKAILNIKRLSDYHYCMNDYPIRLENLTKEDLAFYKKKIFLAWSSTKHKNYIKYFKMLSKPRMFLLYLNIYFKRFYKNIKLAVR